MGVLAMTALACFGSAVAIGMLASSTVPSGTIARGAPSTRGLAIILIAFCEGLAILGVVVGFLAISGGLVRDPASGIVAAGAAVIGALVGIGLIAANWSQADRTAAGLGIAFVSGLAVLGIVVAILAGVTDQVGTRAVASWPFVVLGSVSALASFGIGWTGSNGLRSMDGADEAAMKAIVAAQVSRCALFQFVGIGASVIAIVLVVLA